MRIILAFFFFINVALSDSEAMSKRRQKYFTTVFCSFLKIVNVFHYLI